MSKNIERASSSAQSGRNAVSTSDNDRVFAQLTDMFGDVASQNLITNICISNGWRVDDCIEELIQYLELYGSDINRDHGKKENVEGKDSQHNSEYQDAKAISHAYRVSGKNYQHTDTVDSSSNEDMIIEGEEAVLVVPSQDRLQEDNSQPMKLMGAIPKNVNTETNQSDTSSSSNSRPYPIIDFSTILQKGFKDFVSNSSCSTTTAAVSKKREATESPDIENILKNINAGYRVMIQMRGAPGSGKSFLARTIVDRSIKGDYRNYIFSSDDYFYDAHDRYKYRLDKLPDAHDFNQRRVRKRCTQGWSPIIIDNTNMKIWEMQAYVKYGVANGYIIEILEPDNDWSHSPGKLAAKNRHGVPKDKIERMLSKFEPVTAEELLRINNFRYTMPIPQLRHQPPLPVSMVCEDTRMDPGEENKETFGPLAELTTSNNSNSWGQYEEDRTDCTKKEQVPSTENVEMPKPARDLKIIKRNITTPSDQSEELSDSNALDDVDWKSYEEESNDFWQTTQMNTVKKRTENSSSSSSEAKPQRIVTRPAEIETSSMFNMIKDQVGSLTSSDKDESTTTTTTTTIEKKSKIIERHKIGCRNENRSFAMIRQIYSNKQADGLWDLFEKCNGDVDWVVDILLKDDSCVDQDEAGGCNEDEFFYCRCDVNEEREESPTKEPICKSTSPTNFKLCKQKSRREKDKSLTVEKLEAKQAIERQFKLGDEYYSHHVRFIRNLRHGIDNDDVDGDVNQIQETQNTNNFEEQENDDEDESSGATSSVEDDSEMIELNLGNELINQLEGMFGSECDPKHSLTTFKTNVFMPKSLAKQLYALWMESLYNQIEEPRQVAIKEDEDFARILEDPLTYEKFPKPPNNYKEILDMELAWNIYKSEFEDWRDSTPCDLASHLTQMKLCEIFPNIEKDTLLEIFAAHGNRFADTVEVLKASLTGNIEDCMKGKEKELFEKVKIESAMVINNSNEKTSAQSTERPTPSPDKKNLEPDAKKQVLKDFEECRNLAVHHSQLKAECYQKAKDAIQKGNTSVAVYYSQIANLHKTKIDMYNHKAANYIMEVHDLNQNNPDFIDLHYLHVVEALQCLDIFIDKHITKMKKVFRTYKYLFIITGRGLHSASGVSTIKTKVKARLKQRNLKWSEVNPGLLKVKVFSASKYSKNL